ncbi:vacuolar protein sorting-associated protein 37A-like [Varroa jacobsoni]|uniref:vacuolar protein sorting-associated protein 37A-like n=1 Tax=Varroa jacobsoni TaxID=62625 RepID=UPI000BF42CF2|nr:vacuolar protein sorting-associated protein 37A-like [Varroa jacobsoni]XP_022701833.1 vacuolar protein sorting-associated protein 37A-like [Varroa jacobsoni]
MLRSAKRSSVPSGTSGGNGPEEVRKHKIYELKDRCPGIQERVPESEFTLAFSCAGIEYQLFINLPPNFPFEGPTLSVRPAAEHPLLDDTSTVCGLADLTAFSIHASLPDIIQQVLSDFITRPLLKRPEPASLSPAVGSITASGARPKTTMYMNGSLPSGNSSGGVHLRSSSIYAQVNALSIDDLRDWSSDELKIKEFAEDLPHVCERKEAIRHLIESNEAVAKTNLSVKNDLDKKRGEVLSLYEELTQHRNEFDARQQKFHLLERSYAPETIKNELAKGAREAEKESDEIAQQFLNKELSVDEFLKRFMKTRTLSHERSAKAERLQLQLEALHRAGF